MRTIAFNGTTYACPFSESFRRHSDEEKAAMRESVAADGVQVPVRIYHDTTTGTPNCILDGEGRLGSAAAAGVDPRRVPFVDEGELTTAEAYEKAKTLNDVRRHDDIEAIRERRKRVAAARGEGKSLRTIAEAEGVSEKTVRKDISISTADGGPQSKTPEKVMSRDGRKRPAKQPAKPKKPKPGEAITITEDDEREERERRKKPPAVKDELGRVIPPGLVDTFADPMLAEAVARIDAAHRELVSIAEHVKNTLSRKGEFWPYAKFGECAASLAHAANRAAEASTQLSSGIPFCVCPKCNGAGCKDCRNSGAWPRYRHEGREQYGD